EKIPNSGRYIETGAFVQVGFWPFVTENVLPMVSAEWTSVFPLCIRDAITFANRDPPVFARRNSGTLIDFIEPGNNSRRFGPMTLLRFVVIWKRAVKRIQSRREVYGSVITAMSGIRIIKAAIIFGPLRVPGAYPIRNRIFWGRFLADPKDGCYNIFLPRETLSRLGRISSQLSRREGDCTNIKGTILARFLRFLAELAFCRFRLRSCPVCEQRCDRRKDHCNRVSKFSRFHLILSQREMERRTVFLIGSFARTRMRVSHGQLDAPDSGRPISMLISASQPKRPDPRITRMSR